MNTKEDAVIGRLLGERSPDEISRILSEIENPEWTPARCGDWRRYVTIEVREAWPMLGVESRLVAYLFGENEIYFEP